MLIKFDLFRLIYEQINLYATVMYVTFNYNTIEICTVKIIENIFFFSFAKSKRVHKSTMCQRRQRYVLLTVFLFTGQLHPRPCKSSSSIK